MAAPGMVLGNGVDYLVQHLLEDEVRMLTKGSNLDAQPAPALHDGHRG
jgi:hypothetical protein